MIKNKVIIVLFFAIAVMPLYSLTVKLASPFPENSPWDITLKKVAAEWANITGGQVRMRIYPGGVAGDEGDMIRKMRFNQLDAAVFTSFGMKEMVPNTFIFTLPGLLHSEDELDYMIQEITPKFEDDFLAEGFRPLAWSKSGWAYFFSKNPARTPGLMRSERLAVNNTDVELAENFKALQFNVVPNAMNDMMVGLQSGMLSAFTTAPVVAASYQWFAQAPYMIDFPLAPVVGGIVINERTWQRVPERYHEDLKASIAAVADEFYQESERLNEDAMDVMLRNGLQIERLSQEETMNWYEVMSSEHHLIVGDGKWVDDIYNEFISLLENFRR